VLFRDSTADIGTGYGLEVRSTTFLYSIQTTPIRDQFSFLSNGYRGLYLGSKAATARPYTYNPKYVFIA
jgi:hypothetical protein